MEEPFVPRTLFRKESTPERCIILEILEKLSSFLEACTVLEIWNSYLIQIW